MIIWEFKAYKPYLKEALGAEGTRTGRRKRLAEAIGVHTTLVSQVLNGPIDFTLEQAEAINGFLGHSQSEAEYFIALVSFERAGTKPLKERYFKRIQELAASHADITNRIKPESQISSNDQIKFYSSHLYSFAHVLVSLPDCKTVDALSKALQITKSRAQEVVDFLMRVGLLTEVKGRLSVGPTHVHLSNESPLLTRHHSNYRLHALQNIEFRKPSDLHYSGCWSLSEQDAQKVRELFLENLKRQIDVVKDSKEEVAYVAAFDFYGVST